MSQLQPGPRYHSDDQPKIKAALFDVDNTLVGNESPELPTERFKAAVNSARGKINVGIASARPLAKVAHILRYIDAEGFSVLCNGAQIVRNQDASVVAEWPISLQTCHDLLTYIRSLDMQYWVNDDGVDYFVSKEDPDVYEKQQDIWDQTSVRILVPDFQLSKPFVIVLHAINSAQVKNVEDFIRAHSDDSITSLIAHEIKQPDGGLKYDVFIVNKRANKKDALYEVARIQNLQISQIMAVGDGRNDAVFVGSAGVGIAMGNSAKETLAVATYVAPGFNDDGAAIALEFALASFVLEA